MLKRPKTLHHYHHHHRRVLPKDCKLMHQGCSSAQRQIFHRKLRTKVAVLLGMKRCGSFLLFSVLHSLFSIWTDLKRSQGHQTWRWGERILLTLPSGLHWNSPQGLNISSIRVFHQIRDPKIPISLRRMWLAGSQLNRSAIREFQAYKIYSVKFLYAERTINNSIGPRRDETVSKRLHLLQVWQKTLEIKLGMYCTRSIP